ncbi:MAG: bacterial domain protein, partial [Massilia sp.]|nr:bacterial domain protein [Massilia sp.]
MVSDTGWMIGAFAVGLALTLVLAAFLTPAHWWRRPNLRALAILAAGTWGIGSLLLGLAPV